MRTNPLMMVSVGVGVFPLPPCKSTRMSHIGNNIAHKATMNVVMSATGVTNMTTVNFFPRHYLMVMYIAYATVM